MKNIRSLFNAEQLSLLSEIGVDFTDDKDYSVDELLDMHDLVINGYLDAGFYKDGEPTPKAREWERIIDTFYYDLDI